MATISLLWKTSAGNSAMKVKDSNKHTGMLHMSSFNEGVTYFPTLTTLPLLSPAMDPVMSQNVLLSQTDTTGHM